jgi:16S rRNA (uracil1498-N3)-methyltransferase
MGAGSRGHQSLRWVYCPTASDAGQAIELDRDQAKHLTGVLRMQDGAPLVATNGAGSAFHAVLRGGGKSATIELGDAITIAPRRGVLRVALGLPKNTVADAVVEKLAELGVQSFEPFITSRSVVRPNAGDDEKYVKRWQSIAAEALEQSQQGWLMDVQGPRSMVEFIAAVKSHDGAAFLFASESRDQSSLTATAEALKTAAAQGKALLLILGPEGGFSSEERRDLVAAECRELSLGATVLRVETAVVAATTLACLALDSAERQT